MSQRILQINFKYNVTADQYAAAVSPLARPVSEVPGLVWKVWILNEEESEAGGVHLFESDAAIQAYLASEIVAGIASNPALSDFSIKQFAVMEACTSVTRGPVAAMAAA